MALHDVPLIFVLIGLTFYAVLAGADFGAGMWLLLAGPGEAGHHRREHAHTATAPVWEANHVWLIFVITVLWTAYPTVFGSIASTLALPMFGAAMGIILRGASYALYSGVRKGRELRATETVFALSSVIAPFFLGTLVGAVAARRVPVGNAAGRLFSSWVSPVPIYGGVLAVATGAYLAAVFLAGDARRRGEQDLEQAYRTRALAAGVLAGALAIGGLLVVRHDARPLYEGLVHHGHIAAPICSALAGVATLALVARRAYEPARVIAALAVAAIVVGWALAQSPILLPGLTVARAAAPHETLVLVVIAVLAGAVILFPSLGLLFGLTLRGRFDPGAPSPGPPAAPATGADRTAPLARVAGACALAGAGVLVFADAQWAHAVAVVALLAAVVLGFFALRPGELADEGDA
ncbi:MAG TPA: cytochrome d ubiquinol oxidase subunit II [Solirubrobacteraceae bacterium]|jgi:cytochrome d ubiquinol oxidase subunit II|nr:cytochrome d ubiquinol oxidase subunit II [Solirubrobacteraceae bacterium]